jgi:chromosomal replication initiation ATPase DnaA
MVDSINSSVLISSNIELRQQIKDLKKQIAKINGETHQLKRKLKEARDLIHKYGLGRHNQYVNNNESLVKIKPYQIQAIVENYFDLPYNSIHIKLGVRDKKNVNKARQFYIHFLLKYTSLSKKAISKELGYKDHTTVLYVEKIMNELVSTPTRDFLKLYEPIEKVIKLTISNKKVPRLRQKKLVK